MSGLRGFRALLFAVACGPAAAASAAEALSDNFYFGGLAGVGGWKSAGGSFSPDTLPGSAPSVWTSTQTTPVAPSLSVIFGASRPVSETFAIGLEGEAGYYGSSASNTSQSISQIPFFGFAVTDSRQETTQWSVPAEAALRLRASYKVASSISVFGSLGPVLGYAHVRTTSNDASTSKGCDPYVRLAQCFDITTVTSASSGRWVVDPGLSLNAGLEFAVVAHVSLRGEYAMAIFRPLNGADPSGYGVAKATPLFQEVRLGLVKHF